MRYVWGIAFFVLFLFSVVLVFLFFDVVGLTDVSKMSSIQIWAIVFYVLAVIWALTPNKPAPKIPHPEASADEWRYFRKENEEWKKPDSVVSIKMSILAGAVFVTLLGLVASVGLLVLFLIVRINSAP
jgi:hypothetical protein